MSPTVARPGLGRRADGGARARVLGPVWGFQGSREGRNVTDEPPNMAVPRAVAAPLYRASRPGGGWAPAADGERWACAAAQFRCCRSEELMDTHRVFKMSFASVYPHYLKKAEKKGRTKQEVD